MLIAIDRTQKVKDARSEAAKEVEAYKTQKEKDFKQFESEVCPRLTWAGADG
jgi:Vacuolar (H+)-ATPase G subunit